MSAPPAAVTIRYQGAGDGAELWGGTQADFVIDWPHRPAKEIAIFLQDAAAPALAQALGWEDSADAHIEAARAVGEAWLKAQVAREGHLDSLVVISAATRSRNFCASCAPIFCRNWVNSQPPRPHAIPKLRMSSVGRRSSPP